MTDRIFLDVDPRTLRLPPSRLDGSDPIKLSQQFSKFQGGLIGMPPVLVYRDINGLLMIWDGVTRATRIARYSPGQLVTVEVLRESKRDFSHLPRVEDRLP